MTQVINLNDAGLIILFDASNSRQDAASVCGGLTPRKERSDRTDYSEPGIQPFAFRGTEWGSRSRFDLTASNEGTCLTRRVRPASATHALGERPPLTTGRSYAGTTGPAVTMRPSHW